jgi:tetratricopeptide (TPR) repeat protein
MSGFAVAGGPVMVHGGGVRLDKRAAAVAAAGVAAGVVLGYWSGAVPGVLAVLAGLISAAVVQVAVSWQGSVNARNARLAAAGAAFAPRVVEVTPADAGGPASGGGGVARYLRPEAEVVQFWPRPELDELLGWVAADGERVGVRLVTGAGGSGKTRLARQLSEQAAGLGWREYWVPAGQETVAVRAAGEGGVPVLLIADYAETRTDLPAMLAAAVSDPGGPSLRILLLARSAGEWWRQLQDSCPDEVSDLIAGQDPVTLGPVARRTGQGAVFAEALAAFARLRGIPCPAAGPGLADSDAVVLVVHAAALLAVLDAEAGTGGSPAGGDALGGLLAHERRYWQQSLARRVSGGLDPDVIDRAVTAGFLVGAADQEAAMRLLAVIPDLTDDGQLRGTVARWLRDLYPVPAGAGGQEWIGQLQPDLLTERLAVSVLGRHGELIPCLFAGLGQARAIRALTVLARAALTQPAALPQIQQALGADPEHLLVPAIAVTTTTNPALAALIMNVAAASTLPAATLISMTDAIPYPTVALAALDAAVIRQIVGTLPPDADPAERASWLTALGTALSQLGRPAEALPVTREAVTAYRELAAASPDRYRPDLAGSLTNLGVRFSALGRPAEALPVAQEAVTIRRELAAASPDRYRPDLAGSLTNLGVWFSELGRPAEALPVAQEAVTIRRELAAASPDRYRADLAQSLSNLGVWFSALGRPAEALPVTQEAVTAYRELAAASPDRYRPDLARSLNNLATILDALGRTDEAEELRNDAAAS